ncbi:PREDICTED: uncharacterized protein C4orf19 homolog [Myotis davidii]|uniref:uncharacterized protein C4orf19 homolog n=1 Tax=Myotis davidii TaxID=225400 RepID=UPI0003EBC9C6|nr:PREDICTED: uncharacterized protein C4orf19 homolog [Myotis davidii]XP_006759343.1 PREDICTED: uncharacterized protein C4orf19 homolog [Myotis davidii]XP_006759344.1 PREDICTED: uncharacterized protein C4orf19 homolog [Myotis davidii]XP_015416486.1 PREDICTED: uncharacterized protein C4orf19 homolog [Myotis davidii]
MGCRCCKMIQSYLFDPVQVPSPGYVNEVSSCKLEEEDTVKLKDKQSSEVLVHKNDLQREGLRRTGSRSRRAGPQEPGRPPQGPHPPGDTGGEPCAEKTGGAVNGIGPAVALPPPGDPGPPQGGTGSWTSTANSVPPAHPFLERGGARETDCALPASGETGVVGNGDARVSSEAEGPTVDVPDHVPQIPAPDYPPHRGSAGDDVDHEEKEEVFQRHPEEERPEEVRPGAGEQGLNLPFSFPGKRRWDSLNGAVAAEVLSVHFKEEDPAPAAPVADGRNGWEDAHCTPGGASGEAEEEDAEVAEALAALEAATAGEDVDDVD